MQIDRLLESLSKELELEAIPQKDKIGVYRLHLAPDFEIGISELEPGVYFSSLMMPVPEDGREALFIHLMQANLIGQGTGGGAIGIDPSEKFLTLSMALPFEVSYSLFKDRLEDFVNYLAYWREEVVNFGQKIL